MDMYWRVKLPTPWEVYTAHMKPYFVTKEDYYLSPLPLWSPMPPSINPHIFPCHIPIVLKPADRIAIGDFGVVLSGLYVRIVNCIMLGSPRLQGLRKNSEPLEAIFTDIPPNLPPLRFPDSVKLLVSDVPLPENGCYHSEALKLNVSIEKDTG